MTQWRWKYTPGCNCGDCREYEREQEPAYKFQKMEDERAEFEATFGALEYNLEREESEPLFAFDNARDDYQSDDTGNAWRGWLAAARVEWVPTP